MNTTTRGNLSRVVMIVGALAATSLLVGAFPAPPTQLEIDPAYFVIRVFSALGIIQLAKQAVDEATAQIAA